MSRQKSEVRRYSATWEQLSRELNLTVQLQPITMTPVQVKSAFDTFKRAISKEKYLDIMYRNEYPNAQIKFTLDTARFTVSMTLHPQGFSDKLVIL